MMTLLGLKNGVNNDHAEDLSFEKKEMSFVMRKEKKGPDDWWFKKFNAG